MVLSRYSQLASAKFRISLKKAFLGLLKFNFFLGLSLILYCTCLINLSVIMLKSVPFGIYCLMSLLAFSIAPFCHEAWESAKYTRLLSFLPLVLNAVEMSLWEQNSEPLSVVMVLMDCRYGNSSRIATFARAVGFFPCGSRAISSMLVLLSVRVSIAPFLPFPTIVSISQSPNRFPFASAGRWWMLTLRGMFLTLVVRLGLPWRLYFILCRQWELNSPVRSARMCWLLSNTKHFCKWYFSYHNNIRRTSIK